MLKHKPLAIAFIFFVILTFLSRYIPFFWDGVYFTKPADFFYYNSYSTLVPPIEIDTGNFPLFGFYISLFWNLFGKSLLVSHIAILPILIGIAYEFYFLSKRYVSEKLIWFCIILLFIEPTFITQSIIMAYDLLLVYFYLLSLNCILNNKTKILWLSLTLLTFSSMRGAIAGISLLIFFIIYSKFIHKKQESTKIYLCFLAPLVSFILWNIYHFYKTDWAVFSPLRKDNNEQFTSINMFFRQIIFSLWKMADFGRVFLWLFVIIMAVFSLRKKNMNQKTKEILLLIFIPTILFTLFFAIFTNPIGHRYFLIPIIFTLIGTIHFLGILKSSYFRNFLFSSFCILLITGNLWIYPEKYGNGWDSSLKVLPIFELQKDFLAYIEIEKINPKEIATGFPLINDFKFAYLESGTLLLSDKKKESLSKFKYVLQSNLCNDFSQAEIQELKNNWILLKAYSKGQIYLKFYSKSK